MFQAIATDPLLWCSLSKQIATYSQMGNSKFYKEPMLKDYFIYLNLILPAKINSEQLLIYNIDLARGHSSL